MHKYNPLKKKNNIELEIRTVIMILYLFFMIFITTL